MEESDHAIGDLPLLWHSTEWVAGFHNIVDRVHEIRTAHRWSSSLDDSAPPDNPDVIAYVGPASGTRAWSDRFWLTEIFNSFSSFVESYGQPLLDQSLYASSENYTAATRPAYSRLLTWPDQWFVPSEQRATARARTQHWNGSSLDTSDIDTDDAKHGKSATDFMIPESLRSSRQSVSDVVKQASLTARIRLDGIADAFFHPLEQLLGQKRYLLSERSPSSLDCLAFAYMALALIPVLPEPWLATSMSRYPTLCAYVHDLNQRFWGGSVDINGAIPTTWSGDAPAGSTLSQKQESPNPASLPWKESRHEGSTQVVLAGGGALLEHTLGSLPILRGYWKKPMRPPPPRTEGISSINADAVRARDDGLDEDRHLRPGVVATATALAALGSYLLYHVKSRQLR